MVTLPEGTGIILAPEEARQNRKARAFLERVVSTHSAVRRVESISTSGNRCTMAEAPPVYGLRILRRSSDEVAAMGGRLMFRTELDQELVRWVKKHYRDRLRASDLADPQLCPRDLRRARRADADFASR